MSRVLVTRPQPDADRTAALLRAAGHAPLVHPLMRTLARPGALAEAAPADALAFTSANGVRAYVAAGGAPLPTYAVGEASGAEARALGLPVAGVAGGDVASLARLIGGARPGRVLHPSGAQAAGDLAGALGTAGIACQHVVLYEAIAEDALPTDAAAAVRSGPEWVLLHSPRSARLLTRLVRAAGLAGALSGTRLAALSQAVSDAADLPFAERLVAPRPASSALVDIVSGRDT